jgi:hypothetical protein
MSADSQPEITAPKAVRWLWHPSYRWLYRIVRTIKSRGVFVLRSAYGGEFEVASDKAARAGYLALTHKPRGTAKDAPDPSPPFGGFPQCLMEALGKGPGPDRSCTVAASVKAAPLLFERAAPLPPRACVSGGRPQGRCRHPINVNPFGVSRAPKGVRAPRFFIRR